MLLNKNKTNETHIFNVNDSRENLRYYENSGFQPKPASDLVSKTLIRILNQPKKELDRQHTPEFASKSSNDGFKNSKLVNDFKKVISLVLLFKIRYDKVVFKKRKGSNFTQSTQDSKSNANQEYKNKRHSYV